MTLDEKRKKLEELALKHTSSQTEAYKNSIYLPYITLPNAKGKGTMMEEYFYWLFNAEGIKTQWIRTNENYDYIMGKNEVKVELKVASIGHNNIVAFNQLHFGQKRNVDKFLLIIIKPDDCIDMFLVDKKIFANGVISLQKQHSSEKNECARLCLPYDKMCEQLENFKVDLETLREL